MNDDLNTIRAALQDMQQRARADKRHLDVGILEAAIGYLDERAPPPVAVVPDKPKRGRPSKSSNGAAPASVADLTGGLR